MDQTHDKVFRGDIIHRVFYWCEARKAPGEQHMQSSRTLGARGSFLLPHPDSLPACEWFARPSPRRSSFSWSEFGERGTRPNVFFPFAFFLPHRQTWLSELWPIGSASCPAVRWYTVCGTTSHFIVKDPTVIFGSGELSANFARRRKCVRVVLLLTRLQVDCAAMLMLQIPSASPLPFGPITLLPLMKLCQ